MKWTTNPPTEPGWYWARNRSGDTAMVKVMGTYPFFEFNAFDWNAARHPYLQRASDIKEWAGPIEEPSE